MIYANKKRFFTKKYEIFHFIFSFFNYFLYLCSRFMEKEEQKTALYAMFRRWAYMVVAIIASALLFTRPVFGFREDKGIIYIRSFSMTEKEFKVTQTELENGAQHTTAKMSVVGLYISHMFMFIGSILCFLCFFSKSWRVWLCNLTAVACGAYYLLMIIYAMRMSDIHYATLYPTIMSIIPAIVLQLMILTRHNVIQAGQAEEDGEREALPI